MLRRSLTKGVVGKKWGNCVNPSSPQDIMLGLPGKRNAINFPAQVCSFHHFVMPKTPHKFNTHTIASTVKAWSTHMRGQVAI